MSLTPEYGFKGLELCGESFKPSANIQLQNSDSLSDVSWANTIFKEWIRTVTHSEAEYFPGQFGNFTFTSLVIHSSFFFFVL
jgi:hypothetical protein